MPPTRKTEAIWIEKSMRWQIKVQLNGERKTFYSSTSGRKGKIEAEKKADAWLAKGTEKDPRLETLWKDFLESIDRSVSSANYLKHESIGRLWLLPKFKMRRISSITMNDWQQCINAGAAKGLSKKSCENIRASVTALYKYARKCRVAMERPEDLDIPKKAPVGERNILQPDKLRHLFSVDWITHYNKKIPVFYIHAWRFLVLTGMRRGELCGLRREDIQGNVLHIRRSINRELEVTPGKNENATRYLVITGRIGRVLADQEAALRAKGVISPWVFPDESGERLDPNHLYKVWYTYRNQHGLECSLHELRHTMVSIAKVDVPEDLLKSAIGHSKAMDTKRVYGHVVDGEAERYATIIDEVFNKLLD